MMELGLILTLCGLGVSFLIPAVIIYAISANKKRKCTKSADAVVVDIETRSSDAHRLSFYPVYEYYADGIKYTGGRGGLIESYAEHKRCSPCDVQSR